MMQDELSRRRFPRIPSQIEVGVRRAEKHGSIPMVSTVNDMGLGGCRFASWESFGVGSQLWLTILPKKNIVEALARVVYERPTGGKGCEIGVEFLEISPRDRAVLEQLLTPMATMPPPEGEMGPRAGH